MRKRDSNLDLLRATAILMVLVYHVSQRWLPPVRSVTAFTQYGQYGVDLFFVLSGWLIGGLLWREQAQFGNVQICRFVIRRALRTIPPYAVALGISYLGVLVARRETFNWGYLLFIQNYYERIPYFLISWSLCIEEHFYLFMAALVLCLPRSSRRSNTLFVLLACVPAILRFFNYMPGEPSFGYYYTATHMRYEGLLFGVWASLLRQRHPKYWLPLQRYATWGVIPALLGIIVADLLPEPWRYSTFYTTIAFFFLVILISVVERPAICFSDSKAIFWIASTSYSIYLTHAFTLDGALRLTSRMPRGVILQIVVLIFCIGLSGVLFYRLVELPSLFVRHRFMPARGRERSPLLRPVSTI